MQRFCTFFITLGLTACQLLPSQNESDFLSQYGGIEYVFQMDEKEILLQLLSDNDERISATFAHADNLRKSETKREDYIEVFFQTFQNQYPNEKLASIFMGKERLPIMDKLLQSEGKSVPFFSNPNKIEPNTSDEKVKEIVHRYVENILQKCFHVILARLNKRGIMQPSAHLEKDLYQIIVTIPLHPNNQDILNLPKYLVQDQGIEIWETYTARELSEALVAADKLYQSAKGKPLISLLQVPQENPSSPILGYCLAKDTAAAMQFLQSPEVKSLFPSDLRFQWTKNPTNSPNADEGKQYYECITLKGNENNQAVIDARSITFAKTDNYEGYWVIDFNFDQTGTKIWAKITDENIGKSLAILQNHAVLSYPTVQSRIEGGRCQISGNFDASEAKALADILSSGYLALKLRIISERVVGKK